jgi:phage terminase large subunit-like protein
MLRIDRDALSRLPADEQAQALEILRSYESALKDNPLLGYEPHPKQIVFHAGTEQLKAFLGGNRSGKTTAGVLDDIIQAVDRDCLPDHLQSYKKFEPPFHCRLVCPGEDLLESVIFQKLREWCPASQLRGDRFDKAYEKSRGILHFKNGSFFDFLTYGQDLDKFGGTAKHRIHYDEEPPREIRQEGKMRLLDYEGADEIFTMTPFSGMNWMFDEVWEAWQKGTLEDGKVVVVDLDENPYISSKQKIKLLKGYSKEELEARKSGRFVHFAGMIYGEFSRNEHVIPEIAPDETGQRHLPAGSNVYVGIDPGVRHMAAVLWAYLNPEDTMVIFDELALQGQTVKQVCNAIKLTNQKWGQRTHTGSIVPLQPSWYVIDPSARNIMHQTGRSDQMEYTDHGIVTILGQNDVTSGINRVKERLQAHRLLVTANCAETIDQFRRYRWSTPNRIEDDPKEKPVKTDDHLLDALRYVVASRPYANPQSKEDELIHPMLRTMREEMTGKSWNRRKIPSTPMGGVFA